MLRRRDAARALSPLDIRLMLEVADAITEQSVAELEALYLRYMLMGIAPGTPGVEGGEDA